MCGHSQPQGSRRECRKSPSQLPKRNRGDDEHVYRCNAVGMVAKEGLPALRRRPPFLGHVFCDRDLADINSQFEQFAVNPWRSPQRVGNDLLKWRHSPEGQQFAKLADALCDLMEDVELDAKQRKFIWRDGQQLDLDQSVAHVQKQYPDFRRDWIEEYLIDWIDMDYAPEHYSEVQLDELDKLTARWIADHKRRAEAPKKQGRTRHS
jgi:hypothetical protein